MLNIFSTEKLLLLENTFWWFVTKLIEKLWRLLSRGRTHELTHNLKDSLWLPFKEQILGT